MKNSEQYDELLQQALSPMKEPSDELNQKIISQLKESKNMRPIFKKKVAVALIAATLTLITSVTAVAAWQLLSPKEVASQIGFEELAKAFESEDAITINESQTSGGYNFTLLGVVSGKGLMELEGQSLEIKEDHTYTVVSIANEDKTPMPKTSSDDYGKVPFFVSPLIKGQIPWQVNAFTLGGGYSDIVKDGIMYRLLECDTVEMFADRGISLCISTGLSYDTQAFNWDEKTGEVAVNKNFKGANVLFDLPLDVKKADSKKAEQYLKDMFN